MSTCPKNTMDSNQTGLSFSWERCLKVLPPNPVWFMLEPNSYADFGATITTVARKPIRRDRSRLKGVVTDVDATGGFNQDLTQTNLLALSQAFFFANARERGTTASLHAAQAVVSDVDATADAYTFANTGVASAVVAAGGTGYAVGDVLTVTGGTGAGAVLYVAAVSAGGVVTAVNVEDRGAYSTAPTSPAATTGGGTGCTVTLTTGNNTAFPADALVMASGFGIVANNGIKTVASLTGGVLAVLEPLVDEAAPPADAKLQQVGMVFDATELSITLNGGLVRLNAASVDMSALGIIPGEWVFVGGDAVGTRFTNNAGFARVSVVNTAYLEFDKVDWEGAVADVGTGKTIHLYFGTVLRNETDPSLIVYKPVQLERQLGEDVNGTMSQYLIGGTANELTLNVGQASLCTVDLTFVACDDEQRTGLQGLKTGARQLFEETDAFNSTDSLARVKMSAIDPTSAYVAPMFGFYTDCALKVTNNVSANKAVGHLGAIGTTAGTFEVGGDVTAYFTDMTGPAAVRSNADVTMDYVFVKDNAGIVWDIPLLALGGGNLQVEADQPITIPLETNAAQSKFGHTLLMQSFPYLPDIAIE